MPHFQTRCVMKPNLEECKETCVYTSYAKGLNKINKNIIKKSMAILTLHKGRCVDPACWFRDNDADQKNHHQTQGN